MVLFFAGCGPKFKVQSLLLLLLLFLLLLLLISQTRNTTNLSTGDKLPEESSLSSSLSELYKKILNLIFLKKSSQADEQPT